MIDWQIIVNGDFPPDWDQRIDGCWFPDFDLQRYLLPFFDVGNNPINEYGTTVFDVDDIRRLRVHLEWQQSYIKAKGMSWRITETCDGKSETYEFKRDAALAVIDKTIAMIERAISLNGQLVFRGD
jgi:hypothetical protein